MLLRMDACESLGAGACRERDLWNHVHSYQRSAAQNPAVESSSGGFAWCCVDGLMRHHDARACLSRGQLRHDRALARDDAHLGLSLSRTFFRLGGACCLEILPHAGATTALPHAYVGNSLGPASQRHDLFDADAARNRGYPARKTSDAALPHGASDEREYRQCCYPRRQSTKHDHRPFFTHWIFVIFGGASAAGDYRTRDQLHSLASGVSKDFEGSGGRGRGARHSHARLQLVCHCLCGVRAHLCLLRRGIESGVDGPGWFGARNGPGAP